MLSLGHICIIRIDNRDLAEAVLKLTLLEGETNRRTSLWQLFGPETPPSLPARTGTMVMKPKEIPAASGDLKILAQLADSHLGVAQQSVITSIDDPRLAEFADYLAGAGQAVLTTMTASSAQAAWDRARELLPSACDEGNISIYNYALQECQETEAE